MRNFDQKYLERFFECDPEGRNAMRLTMKFMQAVAASRPAEKNIVVSAYNAAMLLSMVAKGTDANTRDELAKTLFGTDGSKLDEEVGKLVDLNKAILDANKDKVTVLTASGVWVNGAHASLEKDYADDIRATFDADISERTFADPQVVKDINGWADKNTKGLITEIVKELGPDDYAVLASSLYFKGEWTEKFDKALTTDKTFYADGNPDGLTTKMMKQTFDEEGAVMYQDGGDYEAVALTYGKKDYDKYQMPSMRIVLVRPKDSNTSAREWLGNRNADEVQAWMMPYAYESAVGTVELPHIDIEQKHDLIPAMQQLGVKDVFGGAANFSKMCAKLGDKLYLSKLEQSVAFKTNEEGSEAAAITVGMVSLESARPDPVRIDVKLNRSFAFAIQDIETGTVLFSGTIDKPNKAMKQNPTVCMKP